MGGLSAWSMVEHGRADPVPSSVRFGGDTAGTLHEYMYGAVHEAGRDMQAKVARRPRNWIPRKVDARESCVCARRPHIPRS